MKILAFRRYCENGDNLYEFTNDDIDGDPRDSRSVHYHISGSDFGGVKCRPNAGWKSAAMGYDNGCFPLVENSRLPVHLV